MTFGEDGDGVDPSQYDAVIAVIGETPYAEGVGDIGRRTLEAATLYPGDLAMLDRVSGKGAPVVTVFVSGRPLYVNKELNRSDAFVAAWLPGTEGGGVADLLVRARDRRRLHRQAVLLLARCACQTPLNVGDADYAPLFAFGYGLRNGQTGDVGTLPEEIAGAVRRLGRRRHRDRGPGDLQPDRRGALQDLHRLAGELGRHRDRRRRRAP